MQDPSFRELRSARLLVRRFELADAPALAAYRSDPAVARYQGWQAPYPVAEALRFIGSLEGLAPGTPGAWFQFAVALLPDGPLIGDCALRATQEDPRHAELGFSFASERQGRGYASEAVGCVLRYAFTGLALQRVFSITDERNERARRLLERVGFRSEGRFGGSAGSPSERFAELLFARHASEWRSASPDDPPSGV